MQRPQLGNLAALLGWCGLTLGAPSALAPWFAGCHWSIDLAACFVAQSMSGLALATVLLAVTRRWRPALTAAAFTGLAAVSVIPAWCPATATAAEAGAGLRLMSVNLLFDNDAHAADALAAIREQAPDIVFCSEVTPAWLAALDRGLTEFPHRCVQADTGCFGVALFSMLPLQQEQVIALGYGWAPAVRATVRTTTGPIGLLCVHTPRPGDRRHGEERDRALQAIPEALLPLPPDRVVMGDFNATPWNAAFQNMLSITGLLRASSGALTTTWPSTLPALLRIPIDHVLVTPGTTVCNLSIGSNFGSDHMPLAISLTRGTD